MLPAEHDPSVTTRPRVESRRPRIVLRGNIVPKTQLRPPEFPWLACRPVIGRYSLPEMARLWTDEHKLAVWKEVESAALEAWVKAGTVPSEALLAVRRAPTPTPAEVLAREKITDHDLAAFVDLLAGASGEMGRWVHFGLTSSDVLDTALGVVLAEAGDLLAASVAAVFETVRRRALEEKDTVILGRTHGVWAEPTSLGLKLASWAFELSRAHERMVRATAVAAVGKISGAVGSYAHSPPEIEAFVCQQLGLGIEPASTQVTARDRHAEFLLAIALVGASLERMATEIRHLQRSEVREMREPFSTGQKGSSAMPHKRNPIVSERIVGMSRLLRGYAQAGLENVALWHERDISHSSAERVALPDACLLAHYMLVKMERLVDGLVIDRERMRRNLESTGGLVYSQAVLLALIEDGLSRDIAYRIVQENAMRTWEDKTPLLELLLVDPRVQLAPERLRACFDPALQHTSIIFDRLADTVLRAR